MNLVKLICKETKVIINNYGSKTLFMKNNVYKFDVVGLITKVYWYYIPEININSPFSDEAIFENFITLAEYRDKQIEEILK